MWKRACGWRAAARRCSGTAEVILQVRGPGANPETGADDLALLRQGQTAIGFGEPLTAVDAARRLADRGVTFFAMELMPRITRAQSMDVLSSMATIAGYKAVLLAADALPRMFPMMMTAAGTITPARVLVIGAGVAGLQAIATARRLGAVVSGYDVRAAVKEQIESLGAKFVVLDVEAARRGGQGRLRQGDGRGVLSPAARADGATCSREQDVVITTAAVPGKKAPILITREMVDAHGAGVGDCGSRGGARRQLRTDAAGRDGGAQRRHAFWAR